MEQENPLQQINRKDSSISNTSYSIQQTNNKLTLKESSEIADNSQKENEEKSLVNTQQLKRQSTLPQWLLDVDKTLNKYQQIKEETQKIKQEFQENFERFTQKQIDYEEKQKQLRLEKLRKRMSMELDQEQQQQNKEKKQSTHQFNRLKQNIWLLVFEFLDKDIYIQIIKYSYLCRKIFKMSQNPNLMQFLISQYLGYNFISTNERNIKQLAQSNTKSKQKPTHKDIVLKDIKEQDFYFHLMKKYYKSFVKAKITLKNYMSYHCPQEVENFLSDLILAVDFMNDLINLVFLNRSKEILLYELFFDFINNNSKVKGTYILTQLSQCKSEFIRIDARNILISFLALEGMIRNKMKIYFTYQNFLKSENITEIQRWKILNHCVVVPAQSSKNLRFLIYKEKNFNFLKKNTLNIQDTHFQFVQDCESCIAGQMVYNKNFRYEDLSFKNKDHKKHMIDNKLIIFRYDFGINEEEILFIKNLLNDNVKTDLKPSEKKIQFATASLYNFKNNSLIYLNMNYHFDKEGHMTAEGVTEQEKNLQPFILNGKIELKKNIIQLNRNYDYDQNFEYLGEGQLFLKISDQAEILIDVKVTLGMNLYLDQRQLIIFGFDKQEYNHITIKILIK